MKRIRGWQSPSKATRVALAAGLCLLLPSLWLGLVLDDYVFVAAMRGLLSAPNRVFGLYEFFHGGELHRSQIMDGMLPWWTDPELRVTFFRPLSSALLWLDQQCFDGVTVLHHVHSLLWYTLVVLAAGRLYRTCFRGALPALAILLFAIDDAHAMPAGWVANRNTYVALGPALWALSSYVRARESGRQAWFPALPLLCLGLCGGEVALASLPFFLAYEALGSADRWQRRALHGGCALGMLAVYALLYRGQHHGAFGSDFYLDPMSTPFLRELPARLGALLFGSLIGIPADISLFAPQASGLVAVLGFSSFFALQVLLWKRPLHGQDDPRRHLRWMQVAALFALVPSAAAIPSNRLITPAMLAAAPTLAFVILLLRRPAARRVDRPRAALFLARTLIALHLVLPPAILLIQEAVFLYMKSVGERLLDEFETHVENAADGEIWMVNAPDLMLSSALPLMYAVRHGRVVAGWNLMSMAHADLELEITDESRWVLRAKQQPFMNWMFELLFRSRTRPLRTGDRVQTHACEVEVLRADERGILEVGFRRRQPIPTGRVVVLKWDGAHLTPIDVTRPAVHDIPFRVGPMGF